MKDGRKCPGCGYENRTEFRFCGICGMKLIETSNEETKGIHSKIEQGVKTDASVGDIKARHITAGLDEGLLRERDSKKTDFELAQDDKIFDHDLNKQKKKDEAYKSRLEGLLELWKKKEASRLDIRERELEILRENENKILENRSEAPIEVLISVMGSDDPHVREIAEMEMMKRANSLSAEQLLALNTKGDPAAAAEAIGKMNEQRIRDQQTFNRMMQEHYRENAEQMRDVMNAALGAMGRTATARATAQNPGATVIAGGKRTVLVNTNRPDEPDIVTDDVSKTDRKTEDMTCPFCSEDIPDENLYCPACGKRVR